MKRLPNVFSLFLILLLAVGYFGVFADLDWSWQVRTGELIVQTGSLRTPDTFSYTIAGTQVHDFEWLYEVILYLTWSVFGIGGLKFLKLFVIATPLYLVARQQQREGMRWHGIALSLLVAVLVLAPAWNLRPLFVTTIGLLLVSTMLHNHCKENGGGLSWWLPVVMLVWANMHPGVITGQGLLFGAIAWEWLNQSLRWNPPLDRPRLWRLTTIGGIGLAATFLSPDPIERLRYPFKPELAHPIMRIFVEMQPLYTFLGKPPFAVGLIYVVAALVLLTMVLRFRAYRLWEVALFAGLAFLGNFAFRSAMDWLLVMLALGMPHVKELLAQAARSWRHSRTTATLLRIDRRAKKLFLSPLFRWQPAWPAVTVAAFLVVSLIPPLSRQMPLRDSEEWPVAALNECEKLRLEGRFFAPPNYGAYVGWRLGERGKVYVDTRGFFFPPMLLEDSVLLPQLAPGWEQRLKRVLDEYGTQYFLLETDGPRGALWKRISPRVARPLYLDQHTVLLTAQQVRTGLEMGQMACGE